MSDLHAPMAQFDRRIEEAKARLCVEMVETIDPADTKPVSISTLRALPTVAPAAPAAGVREFFVLFGAMREGDARLRYSYEQIDGHGFIVIEAANKQWATALAWVHFGTEFYRLYDEDPRHPAYPHRYPRGEVGRIHPDGSLDWSPEAVAALPHAA